MLIIPNDCSVAILLLQGWHCVQGQGDGWQDDEDDWDQSNCLVESFFVFFLIFLVFIQALAEAWNMEFVKINCSFVRDMSLLMSKNCFFFWNIMFCIFLFYILKVVDFETWWPRFVNNQISCQSFRWQVGCFEFIAFYDDVWYPENLVIN